MIHSSRRRSIGWALTLAAPAAALATAALLSPAGARAASAPACSASQLVTTIRQLPGGGTAGTFYEKLQFTNLGRECTMRGYPGVSAVDVDDHQLGRAAVHQSGAQRTVTLRSASSTSAATTSAIIGFVDTGAIGSGCDQKLAAGLRVYAPNTSSADYVPYVFDACSAGSKTFLEVKPVG